jgi:hypothetical protein
LKANYPEVQWKDGRKSTNYWSNIQNQRNFFDQLALKLGLEQKDDWYSVSVNTVLINGGSFLSKYKGSLLQGKNFISRLVIYCSVEDSLS